MSQEILSSLTAERLDELAQFMEMLRPILCGTDGPCNCKPSRAGADIVAALRALAKAERLGHSFYVDPNVDGFRLRYCSQQNPHSFTMHEFSGPTLLAALGSVGQQEKHDGMR